MSDSSSLSSDQDSDVDWGASKRPASKPAARSRIKRAKFAEDSDDNENHRASSEDEEEENDGLDEDLMGDEADRQRLAEMTEREREEELFRRAEKREAIRSRQLVKSKLKLKQKERDTKVKSRSSKVSSEPAGASPDPVSASSSRKKTLDDKKEAKSKFAALLKEREEKKKKLLKASEVFGSSSSESSDSESEQPGRPPQESSRKGNVTSLADLSSSTDSESSDGETSDAKRSSDEADVPEVPITKLSELSNIRLSRYKLERWVHMPFFTTVATGCFVRIGIGSSHDHMVYRVAEINDVVETAKTYQLGGTRTNKGFVVTHGRDRKMFRLEFVSNQEFTQTEFDNWLRSLDEHGLSPPTVQQVERKVAEIRKYMNYEIKDEKELEQIIQEKKRFSRGKPNLAIHKTELLKEIAVAESQSDASRVADLKEQLNDLELQAIEVERRRTRNINAITEINMRNRKENMKMAEAALKREYDEVRELETQGGDPFTRRTTRPSIFSAKRKEDSFTPSSKPAESEEDALNLTPVAKSCDGDPAKEASDPFDVHNFDIQIDLEVQPSVVMPPRQVPASKPGGPPRRSLNLDEYKKRKGLI